MHSMAVVSGKRSRKASVWVFLAPWLALLFAAAAGGVYLSDRILTVPERQLHQRLAEQRTEIAQLEEQSRRLETFIRLLRVTERRVRIEVLDQNREKSGLQHTKIQFTEIDAAGAPVAAPRDFTLAGREAYVDTLTVRFETQFVDKGDPLKGGAVMLFRRAWTKGMRPDTGTTLDYAGRAPAIYAPDKCPTDFETGLWRRIWEAAANEAAARQSGVRRLQRDTPIRFEAGKTYHAVLGADGEVSISTGATRTY